MPSGPTHPPLTVTTFRFMKAIAKKASLWHPGPKPRSSQDERLIVITKNLMQDQELNLPEHAHCSNIYTQVYHHWLTTIWILIT